MREGQEGTQSSNKSPRGASRDASQKEQWEPEAILTRKEDGERRRGGRTRREGFRAAREVEKGEAWVRLALDMER